MRATTAETRAREIGAAIICLAQADSELASISSGQLRQACPHLTTREIRPAVLGNRAVIQKALADAGLVLVQHVDSGPGSGIWFILEDAT